MLTTNDARNMALKMLHRAKKDDAESIARALWLTLTTVQTDGNFTTALVELPDGLIVAGSAKRNPIDAPDALRGGRLATSRAIRKMFSL